MTERPTKCPICGSKITKITNAVTKNSYFKCSNKECLFVLGQNYTNAEFNLQGHTLKTTCLKCKNPLTVVNGPYGLYPRCMKCPCDLVPTTYDGKTYQKWVNAQRTNAKEEIESLVKSFNSSNTLDELYDFETYVGALSSKNKPISVKDTTLKTNRDKILSYLKENLETPVSSKEISKSINAKINSVRTELLSLRSLRLVKVVDYETNIMGNHTLLYQVAESPLPEIKVYAKKDKYNTILSFLKENKYKNIVRAKDKLIAKLRDNGIEPVLFQSTNGICSGYSISLMEELLMGESAQSVSSIENSPQLPSKQTSEDKITEVLKKNLLIPYTIAQIADETKEYRGSLQNTMRKLKKSKKVKIVGWNYKKGQSGATALQYQLSESPLPKLKTTVDNNVYLTLGQFYKKKLRGKRTISFSKVQEITKELPVIPLIVKQKAYAGYLKSDLKETLKEYIGTQKKPKSYFTK